MLSRRGWVALVSGLLSVCCVLSAAPRAAAQSSSKAKFEIYPDAKKEYRWRFKAGNGETLVTGGQGYKSKSSCQDAVEKIKANAATDKYQFEVYQDNAGKYRFRTIASNGQNVASSSQGYQSKADCQHAIDVLKKEAKAAKVEVLNE
jgi:uncharacterized protein YegP (UPF0339 family)